MTENYSVFEGSTGTEVCRPSSSLYGGIRRSESPYMAVFNYSNALGSSNIDFL